MHIGIGYRWFPTAAYHLERAFISILDEAQSRRATADWPALIRRLLLR